MDCISVENLHVKHVVVLKLYMDGRAALYALALVRPVFSGLVRILADHLSISLANHTVYQMIVSHLIEQQPYL